jgi:hypothetical protein
VANIRKTIEAEIQRRGSKENWRCSVVVKEARNPHRVRVICSDEGETQLVKEVA